MLSRIAHKHVSLGILPEQYDVLYQYLFESIAHELSDVLTAEIAAAWTEVYWLMAHALINKEMGLYAAAASDKPLAPWTVTRKVPAGSDTDTRVFTVKLDNDGEVSPVLHLDVEVGDQLTLSNPARATVPWCSPRPRALGAP